LLSADPQLQNKPSPTIPKPPPFTHANQPKPGPSKPRETGSTIKSPTETQAPRSVVQGSSADTQTNPLSSRRQKTNQATGSDRRSSGKTQLIPHPIMGSSSLSTKNRIAEVIAKGPAFLGTSNKYAGLRIPKNVNPPRGSGSPVVPSTTNQQSPLDSPQRAPLPGFLNGHGSQAQIRKPPVQQHSPPPPQPEEPSHNIEPDRMDVDPPEFVHFPHCFHSSNLHQPELPLLLPCPKISRKRKICCTR